MNSVKTRCAECRRERGHKMSCTIGRGTSRQYPLPKRNPGLSLRCPERAYRVGKHREV